MLNVIKLTRILKLRKLNNTQSMIIIPIPSSSDTALLDFLVNLTNNAFTLLPQQNNLWQPLYILFILCN